VIAQLLLMGRRIENWLFWLAVNTVAVPLYASRGLYLTAILYAIYWINAVVAWRWWRRLARQPQAQAEVQRVGA
jgi:nicotinamide mononucleotide transporter